MSNGDPDFWVMAEYSSMLTVLEFANRENEFTQNGVALLEEAREKIRERGISDKPRVKVAVTAVREVVLGIISRALEPPLSADPLGDVWITVGQIARDWHIKHP